GGRAELPALLCRRSGGAHGPAGARWHTRRRARGRGTALGPRGSQAGAGLARRGGCEAGRVRTGLGAVAQDEAGPRGLPRLGGAKRCPPWRRAALAKWPVAETALP